MGRRQATNGKRQPNKQQQLENYSLFQLVSVPGHLDGKVAQLGVVILASHN